MLDDRYVADEDSKDVIERQLPAAAHDIVYKYLYQLEEETDLHIWNEGQIARAALPLMIDITSHSDASPSIAVVKAALAMHCTEEEVEGFLKHHGLRADKYSDDEWAEKMEAGQKDHAAAMDAAHILAGADTPEEVRAKLADAINEFSMSTGVPVWHPAFVERALTIMFESMSGPFTGESADFSQKDRQRDYERLHALLAELNKEKDFATAP